MAGGSGAEGRSLEETPTWALAAVCFVFIAVSIFVEHLIHLLGNWLKRHRKAALFEAVEKLKSVLMLFGVMSLILAVTQRSISKICIPSKVAYTMLPCRKVSSTKTTKALGFSHLWTAATAQNSLPMKDLFRGIHLEPERRLAEEGSSGSSDYCESQGKTSFISQDGINQLNNFLFVLAMMQIVYSVLTMALGRAKMRRWKSWEMETQTVEYQVANDPNRFRFTRETTFGRRHVNSCAKTTTLLWIKCFFRQFFHSVAKVDYLTLRHGFISTHMSTSKSFNFQQYIQRSLEDDFKAVVGISPHLWFIAIIFMLVDVHGWNVYLWVSFIPLLTVLVLGTKLEVIVASMGMKLHDQNSVVIGTPLVEPNDNLFWFGQPKFVSTLLHFILFVTAFELAFLIWVTAQFGFNSCYHEHTKIIIIRVVLAVTVQVMCSYITLPLYALVTQMGSNFKSAVLGEQTMKTIKKWQSEVKGKRKKQDLSQFSVQDLSSTTTTLHTSTSSFSHPSSHHRKQAPSVSEMTDHFSSETEIEVQYQNHPQVGHNEVERVVVLSTPHDIEITEVEGRQSITKLV